MKVIVDERMQSVVQRAGHKSFLVQQVLLPFVLVISMSNPDMEAKTVGIMAAGIWILGSLLFLILQGRGGVHDSEREQVYAQRSNDTVRIEVKKRLLISLTIVAGVALITYLENSSIQGFLAWSMILVSGQLIIGGVTIWNMYKKPPSVESDENSGNMEHGVVPTEEEA